MILNHLSRFAEGIAESDLKIPTGDLGGDTVRNGLQVFFAIAGAVAMLIIALGAFRYVISRGDANAIKNAKESIIYAAIGLIVTMTGYGIVTFVLTNL